MASEHQQVVVRTLRHMTEGGQADNYMGGTGRVYRPFSGSRPDGRVATLETLYDYFIDNVPDPDQAYAKDPDFLNRLHEHPYVASDMDKRRQSVSSLPWRIDANPDAADKRAGELIAAYVSEVWRSIPRITSLYDEMQDAVLQGGKPHEFIWHLKPDGIEVPVNFYGFDKSRVVFDIDGNMALLTRPNPVWGSYIAPGPMATDAAVRRDFPLGKFQYHVHKRRAGTWQQPGLEGYMYFGVGEDVPLYTVVTFSNFVMRFRMKWLEKYGLPPTVLYHPNNVAMSQDIVRIADSLRGESIITIPRVPGGQHDGLYKVDRLDVPQMTNDAFSKFETEWTRPCVKDILLGGDGGQYGGAGDRGGGGGYSAHVSQQDSGPNVFYRSDARRIDDTLNSGIIMAIAWQRFPNLPLSYMPKHRLEPKEERDRSQEMQIAASAAQLVPLAMDEIYERSGFRKPKPGEAVVGGPQKNPQGGQPGQSDAPGGGQGSPDGASKGPQGGLTDGGQVGGAGPSAGGAANAGVPTPLKAGGASPIAPGSTTRTPIGLGGGSGSMAAGNRS